MSDKSEMLINEVNKILKTYETRLTLRQVYYQLVAKLIIPNNINSYKSLGKILVKAREQRKVDSDRIEDRGRTTIGGDFSRWDKEQFYKGHEDSFRACYNQFHRPVWWNQPKYVEVWVEKDALSRLVSQIADNLGVVTCVARGYSSYSFVNSAAKRIEWACQSCEDGVEKRPVILYFGDFDPSGEDMVRDLGRRLWDYGLDSWYNNEDGYIPDEMEFVSKLALTPAQITKYRLPPAPVKLSDVRAAKFIEAHGTDVVELDALDPRLLQQFVSDGIKEHLDTHIQAESVKEEIEERQWVKEKVEAHFRGE